MENNNPLANYIVKRLGILENEVERLKEEREALRRELAKVEEMAKVMREYFRLDKYADGEPYIDHTYRSKSVQEIAEFIGLTDNNEEEDDENVRNVQTIPLSPTMPERRTDTIRLLREVRQADIRRRADM